MAVAVVMAMMLLASACSELAVLLPARLTMTTNMTMAVRLTRVLLTR